MSWHLKFATTICCPLLCWLALRVSMAARLEFLRLRHASRVFEMSCMCDQSSDWMYLASWHWSRFQRVLEHLEITLYQISLWPWNGFRQTFTTLAATRLRLHFLDIELAQLWSQRWHLRLKQARWACQLIDCLLTLDSYFLNSLLFVALRSCLG